MLSSMDLRKERPISMDDDGLTYSSGTTDWRAKYNEVLDMLAETKAELDEFHHASKELEAELEAELARTEQAQQDLKIKVARAEGERDDWKTRFMSLQTTHNTTTTSLQRELDKLRQDYQSIKVQLRDLEMGNDDLERNERAISSSLADMEAKYSRVLEEKILLEQELLEKVHLEEETQRLKDELRDASEENSVLKNRLTAVETAANEAAEKAARRVSKVQMSPAPSSSSEDLGRPTNRDLDLSELSPSKRVIQSQLSSSQVLTPRARAMGRSVTQSTLQRSTMYTKESPLTALKIGGFTKSTSAPLNGSSMYSPTVASGSRLPTRGAPIRSSTSTTSTVSKSKGVQMVSDMRARVRNLEQRIGTKVPRLRMPSVNGRASMSSQASTAPSVAESTSSAASHHSGSSAKTSWESQRPSPTTATRKPDARNSSDDSLNRTMTKKEPGNDSGWVLIMEDSPSPQKMKRNPRPLSTSVAGAPTSYRTLRSKSPSLSTGSVTHQNPLNKSVRRPASRQAGSLNATTRVYPSRPTTPTNLPKPTGGLASSTSAQFKRSIGPNGVSPYKRPPMGASISGTSYASRDRSATQPLPPLPRPIFASDDRRKVLPQLPPHPSTAVRPKMGSSTNGLSNILSKSRIGRPPSASGSSTSGRRNSGDPHSLLDIADLVKPRNGR